MIGIGRFLKVSLFISGLFCFAIVIAIVRGQQQPPSTWSTILHFNECELPCWIGITNRPLATRKEQNITVSAPPDQSAMCDADRIREAIDNLVSNAVKYSPIGGAIALAVSREGNDIAVYVRDQGAGLSPEDMSRLFGRFQRLSAKPTGGETSTGLGLSIVKRIIDLHGGRITVESAGTGAGATFKMTLPVR